MMEFFRLLADRLRHRDDSEHQQALVRLVWVVLFLAYLVTAVRISPHAGAGLVPSLMALTLETVIGLLLVIDILRSPAPSYPRRWIGMLADYGIMCALMIFEGAVAAPLYVIYLWVTIGNGLRYGRGFLYAAIGLAAASFLVVILVTPYWRQNQYMAWGLFMGLVAIPLYLSSLLKALTNAIDEAGRANAAKSRFLATMSHEFRSPLNGIIGMAELLSTMRLGPEQRECSDVIQTSAQTLLMLVEDVLDISSIEAGKLRRVDVDMNLRELLRRSRTMLQPLAAAKGIGYTVDMPETLPSLVHGDSGHLLQVLLNLQHNAIKFTERGSVTLEVAELRRDEDRIGLRFSVRDTGIGIPAAERTRIFQAFEQVESGPTRRFGGTGLGTTIAKTLTELMGGRIGLEENIGGGSHFWVELEFGLVAPPALVPDLAGKGPAATKVIDFDDPFVRHRARVRPLRILVADDIRTNRTVLQRLLEQAGHTVTVTEDGEQALDRLVEEPVDLAIIDLHMPGLSGLDVIRQMRVMQAGSARTPIIALSADATPEAMRAAEAAGAHTFLTKPIVVVRLLQCVADVASGRGETPVPAPNRSQQLEPRLCPDVLHELASMGLGEAFIIDFVDQCLADASLCISNLERAGSKADWEAVREAAHALKGVSANLGAQGLAQRCTEIMRCSATVLARDWRQRFSGLDALLQATAQQARREARTIASPAADPGMPGQDSL